MLVSVMILFQYRYLWIELWQYFYTTNDLMEHTFLFVDIINYSLSNYMNIRGRPCWCRALILDICDINSSERNNAFVLIWDARRWILKITLRRTSTLKKIKEHRREYRDVLQLAIPLFIYPWCLLDRYSLVKTIERRPISCSILSR